MPVEAVGQNSVVVANQVNPSIFTPTWLMEQNVIPRDQISPGAIFAPQIVQLQTNDYQLMVLPDRIQIVPNCNEDRQAEVIQRVMSGVIRLLPHTPYTAAGLNFTYEVHYAEGAYRGRNRELFAHNNPIAQFFAADDARFGGYYSQKYLGCRLRVDVKPAHNAGEPADEFLAMSFNFNKEVKRDTAVEDIISLLGQWDEARALSKQIANSIQ